MTTRRNRIEQFFFYSLEHVTGKHFIHGEPVCLGILFISCLQENDPDGILQSIREVGVRLEMEETGITWEEAKIALERARAYAEEGGLFYTILNERVVTSELIEHVREWVS